MTKRPLIKRSTDRFIVPEDFRQYDLSIREEPKVPPSVGIFDAPVRCYVINHEWDAHITGAISALAEWRSWVGDDDERSIAVQEVLKLLGNETDCSMTFQLRQNPGNPCQLQQSFDGTNWTLAFDYSLCGNEATREQLDAIQSALDDLLALFDGNVNSVAPNMVYDATSDDDIRDIALCHAIHELVLLMCDMELEYRRQIAFASNATAVFLGLIGIAVTVATAGTTTPLYLALSTALAGGFGTIFGGLSEVILRDSDAQDAVACCMYDALKGATITQANFEGSLGGCGFTGTTNEAQLSGAIAQMLTQDDMYVTFLDYLERSFKLAELGIADCGCGDGTWSFTIGGDSGVLWSDHPQLVGNNATIDVANNWIRVNGTTGQASAIIPIGTLTNQTVTSIDAQYYQAIESPNADFFIGSDQTGTPFNRDDEIGLKNVSYTFPAPIESDDLPFAFIDTGGTVYTNTRIQKVTFHGTGNNPL